MEWCVYIHRLKSDGRVYVGQTNDTKKRWCCNGIKYKPCRHFWNAIQKYGWSAFEHIVVLSSLTKEEADVYEDYLIDQYDSMNPYRGFNLRSGGGKGSLSEETRRKISEARSGEKHPNYGRRLPEAHRRHISEANRGEKNGFYGRHHTEETKRILREKRAKQPDPMLGRHVSDEAKANMRRAKIEKAKSVLCVETGQTFVGLKEAGRQTNIDRTSIGRCCKGKQGTAGGYHWRFA